MKTPNGSRQKLRRNDRRQAIISGAARAFVEHGYEATSLDDVAHEAGISRVLLYRHFDSKKALYEAILEGFRTQLPPPKMNTDIQQYGTERLDMLIKAAQADPNGFRLMFRHAPREPEFRAHFEAIQMQRFDYFERNLQSLFPNKQQRMFIVTLLRDIVIDTLLTWIDAGLPQPESMPPMIRALVQSIVTTARKDQTHKQGELKQ